MDNHISIFVTLGPSSLNPQIIETLTKERRITLFRINLSHTPTDAIENTIHTIQRHTDIPICLDSEGAQIRNQFMNNDMVTFQIDDLITIHFDEVLGDSQNISFSPRSVVEYFTVGDIINIDYNNASIVVIEVHADCCIAKVKIGGNVGSNKAVNINRHIPLPPVTDKDKDAISIGIKMGIKHFALSFTNCKEDALIMRDLIGIDSILISKIETRAGALNLDEILQVTNSILIDRGDLSREVPIETIPLLQRIIISKAKSKHIPVYVATNLLESMISAHTPTRAEVNDVISTLLMGADGLVLASETAIGRFPVESVLMIEKLINQFHRWTLNISINEILE